jgi:hypothetical protein
MLGSSIDTGLISYRLDGLFSALALAHRLPLHKLSRGRLLRNSVSGTVLLSETQWHEKGRGLTAPALLFGVALQVLCRYWPSSFLLAFSIKPSFSVSFLLK